MSGGAVRIQIDDFSVEDEVRAIRSGSKKIGAVVTFLGTARDFSGEKTVEAIEFEQYKGMALKAMESLRREALDQFDVIDVSIIHRAGRVEAGAQIVLIAAASEHRKDAFLACEWCIDTLKETVPLWKKEITPEGDSWVMPHP